MKHREIIILENDKNKKGDLFCRLVGDLFHVLGYNEPRFNISKSGREIDLSTTHRTERKIAIAECKAHEDRIGGADINKFIGALDGEKRKIKKNNKQGNYSVTGYYISLSGFKETAIEQELEIDDERLILIKPEKLIDELISGKIIVSLEQAIHNVPTHSNDLQLSEYADLFAYDKGWIWVIYFTNGQKVTHYSLIHAEGKPLILDYAKEIQLLDLNQLNKLKDLIFIEPAENICTDKRINIVKEKYFKYLETECGEIQFEGLPTDKDAGSVKVKLENIFVPLHLEKTDIHKAEKDTSIEEETKRIGIGQLLCNTNRLTILAKPGGGKSTLIKRLAIAYAYPERRGLVNDELPDKMWFPIFIRCRELGEKVTSNIIDVIENVANRAELTYYSKEFSLLVSDELQKGNVLLLIDGLDEISEDKYRIAFVNQLRTFLAIFPKTNFIATSREAGFRAIGGALSNYCTHFKLSKLSPVEIEDLCIRWHKAIVDDSENTIKDAKNLAGLILRDSRIKVLAENPLLLTTLLFVKRWAGYLPTKKNVLYQEMIKLLLVTWNVEGHEQLDIDEAEPQLAYVAYKMTVAGKQTITLNELKEWLTLSRAQMPDILGYTKISVPDFIKRVESRSSLLIMSGHQRQEDNSVIPVYEFLHLSFQEYLSAKSIVEKYLPLEDSVKSNLEILEPHIENESWKEVIPLVAALSKRDTKELIIFLTNESQKIAENPNDKKARRKRISPPELLGNCLAYEVIITPDILENAIEWFAKNRYNFVDRSSIDIILNNKFGDIFRKVVHDIFFKNYNDKYMPELGGLLGEIFVLDYKEASYLVKYNQIADTILKSKIKEEKCIGILSLMELAFILSRPNNNFSLKEIDLNPIFDEFEILLSTNDNHYLSSICWSFAWILPSVENVPNRMNLTNLILNEWLNQTLYNVCRMASWALYELVLPSLDLSTFNTQESRDLLIKKYNKSKNDYDKIVSVFVRYNLNMSFDKKEIEAIFQERNHDKNKAINEYAKILDIDLKKNDNDDKMPAHNTV